MKIEEYEREDISIYKYQVPKLEYIVETNYLSKSYKNKKVVDSVNMHVRPGEVYGFVGPNGAGKSTVLKMLMNLTKPDSGCCKIFGEAMNEHNYEILRRIGSIIEYPYFYDNLTGKENLELHCDYMGYKDKNEIDKILDLVSLKEIQGKAVDNYSVGMKQRLAIARAILTKPELLILDEPLNGLDPQGILEIRSLIKTLKEDWGMSIIISSHILSEMELIADTIGIIKNGNLIKEVLMEDIQNENSKYIEIEVDNIQKTEELLKTKLEVKNYRIVSKSKMQIYDMSKTGTEISSVLINHGVGLESIYKEKNSLENYFFSITKEEN